MARSDIESMISRYGISPVGLHGSSPQLRITRAPTAPAAREAVVAQLKESKPEILEYFRAKEAEALQAAEDRRQRIRTVCTGIDELRACAASWEHWMEAQREAMDDPHEIISLPEPPAVQYSDLAARYPVAAAYLRAESYSLAEDYRKSAAGRVAMDKILNGEEVAPVMEEMEHWLPESAIWD